MFFKLLCLLISAGWMSTRTLDQDVESHPASRDGFLTIWSETFEDKNSNSVYNLLFEIESHSREQTKIKNELINGILIPFTIEIKESLFALSQIKDETFSKKLLSLETKMNTLYFEWTKNLPSSRALEIRNVNFTIIFLSAPGSLSSLLWDQFSFGESIFDLRFINENKSFTEEVDRRVAFARFCKFDKHFFSPLQEAFEVLTPVISIDWVKLPEGLEHTASPDPFFLSTVLNFSSIKEAGVCYKLNASNSHWLRHFGYQYKYCNVSRFNSSLGTQYFVLGETKRQSEASKEFFMLFMVYIVNLVTILLYMLFRRGGIKNLMQFRDILVSILTNQFYYRGIEIIRA